MTLDDAKAQLEALPGVYDVSVFDGRDNLDDMPKYVRFDLRVASSNLLAGETQRGIMEIQELVERDLACIALISVSAGLRMPNREE